MDPTTAPLPFPATMWSKVLRAREESTARLALDQLCGLYWQPVVSYVRALGCGHDEAEDVAQEFFATFLRREGFQRADQERGTLRSYLKTAIRYHVLHWRRDRTTQRRGGGAQVIELDADDAPELPSNDIAATHYDEQWAITVMERALNAMKEGYAKRGKSALFEHLKPTLMSADHGDATAVAETLGISRGTFAVEQHRARRRLADLLREEVAQTVADPAEIDAELLHLLRVLAQTTEVTA
jgi:RNA polymerase sigma-70 factor (ECF subfamily)